MVEDVGQRGKVGSTSRLNVDFMTPAKEAYQASTAVRMPLRTRGGATGRGLRPNRWWTVSNAV